MAHMAARSAAASAALGTFAPRTIFVRVSPAPLTFAERRAVLHALKKHCRIDFFKKIKNNPSSFLSLAETQEAASSLIEKSPLKYLLATGTNDHHTPSAPAHGTDGPGAPPTAREAGSEQEASARDGTTEFVIHIFPRHAGKKHAELVQDSALYGPWPAPPDTTSFVARNLRKSIPDGPLKDGLADWETGGQLREDGDTVGEAAGRGPEYYVLRRQQRRDSKMKLSGVFEDT